MIRKEMKINKSGSQGHGAGDDGSLSNAENRPITHNSDVPKRPSDCFPERTLEYIRKQHANWAKYGRPKLYSTDWAGSYGKARNYGQAS